MIQQTNLGMASWDAFARNLYEGIPLDYKFLTPIIALVLIPIAYLIQKKKWSLWMLFPLGISFVIGTIIDFLLVVIPSVASLGLLWNLAYLALALLICAVGLNLIVWCRFPMPALDELCYGVRRLIQNQLWQGQVDRAKYWPWVSRLCSDCRLVIKPCISSSGRRP
ncbi:MAG: hypothetical protein MZU97_25480 [Bacillus subtilis]|nr:hypothetical protein [Bacillus subtilis]